MESTGSIENTAGNGTVRIRAHHDVVKRLGAWTTARRFDVRASQGLVVLDLLLPRLEPGDVELLLDVDHSVVKLIVPDGAVIDHGELRRIGRGRVKDWTGVPAADGRVIRLLGEMRRSEVRIHRGGVGVASLVLSGAGGEVRRAHEDGRLLAASGADR